MESKRTVPLGFGFIQCFPTKFDVPKNINYNMYNFRLCKL